MANVFISYRRSDSAPYAGRICDRLGDAVGPKHVFMDVQDIAAGENFAQAIDATIARCQFVLVIIGPQWLASLQSRAGEADFVEHEIATALQRGITVIPIVVGDAAMPLESDLPAPLKDLASRQAVVIRDESFDADVSSLLRAIRTQAASSRRAVSLIVAAGIVIAVTGSILLLSRSRQAASVDGQWMARMQREGARPYTVRFVFRKAGAVLSGSVEYPTGTGAIHDGSIRNNKVAFSTRHVPQFESSPATVVFTGELRGREMVLTATMPDGGSATGTALKSGP